MSLKDVKTNGGRWSDPDQARAAAKRSREVRGLSDVGAPAVFVLRMPHPSPLFAWEVRRYTALVLARGDGYATEALARAAGLRALTALPPGPAAQPGPGAAPQSAGTASKRTG